MAVVELGELEGILQLVSIVVLVGVEAVAAGLITRFRLARRLVSL